MRRILLRLGLLSLGLTLGAAVLEAGLRLSGQGLRGQVGLFEEAGSGHVKLRGCATDRVQGPDGRVTTIHTDPAGHRVEVECVSAGGGTLILGDSQVFGLGVEYAETFAAQLGAVNAGVPDYGILDALAAGSVSLPTVVVVFNQANDWEDGLRLVGDRSELRWGYLFRRDRLATRGASLWSTPLAHSALFYRLWLRLNPVPHDPPPEWLMAPAKQRELSTKLAIAVKAYAAVHDEARVIPVWLPADLATSEARAMESILARGADVATLKPWQDTTLRDQVAAALAPLPLLDLTPALHDPANFLAHDFHLSVQGHSAVAKEIRESGQGGSETGGRLLPEP